MRLFEGDLNKWRLRQGPYGSDDSMKDGGVFQIPYKDTNTMLFVIATSGNPPLLGTEIWEHVSARAFDDAKSASPKERTPTWDEMCFLKDIFWHPEECVIQYHPPKSQYVNVHPHVLHLWRQAGVDMPTPPKGYIG